jgi:MoxR-like ATPase
MLVNGIEVRFMPPKDLVVHRVLPYIDSFSILPLLMGLAHDPRTKDFDPPNILLSGPKGIGKTLLFYTWAQQQGIPYISLDCSEETKDRHTKGGFVILPEGGTVFVLGKLANAILAANLHGSALVVLEEMNALPPQQQKNLNSFTDFRRKLEIPELGWHLELQDDASLLIAGTMNNAAYGGTYELNEDLKSRFHEMDLPYPSGEAEKAVLRSSFPAGTVLDENTIDMLVRIGQQTRQETTAYALSPRDLVQLLHAVHRVGWTDALFLAGQKFSSEDRKLILDRIKDITKISVWPDVTERAKTIQLQQHGPKV